VICGMMAVGKCVARSALAATVASVACGSPGIRKQSEGGAAHEKIEVLLMPCLLSELVRRRPIHPKNESLYSA
jgi:hypothetical protein